ncbi:hypothetical protein [Moorena sp. SIO3H5]|uniref:hypothetical protein n=1 Tax=Moorena sp. SIO3H5 TaxID=2607834 RepID=UPI0013BE1173|nr:hypothetical protein [Moorena sp. SIO3H5]NEO71664.1 hypothetical protein [Moorena sp. SIO3H5]
MRYKYLVFREQGAGSREQVRDKKQEPIVKQLCVPHDSYKRYKLLLCQIFLILIVR